MAEHVFPHQPLAAQAEHEVLAPFMRQRLLHTTSTLRREQLSDLPIAAAPTHRLPPPRVPACTRVRVHVPPSALT
jgi:hypothetical protein